MLRFYPVATVNEVIHDSGQPFAIVRAIPTAALNRSRYMLLVFSDRRSPEQRATDAAIAQEEADRKGTSAAGQPATTGEQGAPAGSAPATPATPAATPAAPAAAPATPAAAPAAPAHTRRQ